MCAMDPFRTTDKLDESILQVIGTRLEARGKHPFFARMLKEYLDAMDIDAADRVLDLGCGTGLAARAIVRRERFSGSATGIDLSPHLIGTANRLAAEEGVSDRATFATGDTRRLDFADETFDAVVAHTLLSHVDDPLAVTREALRVVRRGGLVGIFDGDYASLTFGNADSGKGKADDETLIRSIVTSPHVMRQMPRLLTQAGLELVASFSYVLAEIGHADFWRSGIDAFRQLMAKAGSMSEQEADAWADALSRDSDAGVFFGACNYYSFVARRP